MLLAGLTLALSHRAMSAPLPASAPACALQTCLAYVVTGDSAVDRLSRDGLASLSDFVTSRSAAILAAPVGVSPGHDDLSLYPLIYWPIVPGDPPPNADAIAALNRFMENGGIIVIDSEGGDSGGQGSGAGMQPGATEALRQAVTGLDVPPLAPLTEHARAGPQLLSAAEFPRPL